MTSTTTSKTGSTYRRPATEEARQHMREYQKRYRRNNPDRVRKWQQTFYLRQAEKLKAEGVTGDVD